MPGSSAKSPDKVREPKDGQLKATLNLELREITISSIDQIQLLKNQKKLDLLKTLTRPSFWSTFKLKLPPEVLEEFLALVRSSRLLMTTTQSLLMLKNSRRPCQTSELVSTINKLFKPSESSIEMAVVRFLMTSS